MNRFKPKQSKICEDCGKEFNPNSASQKRCSDCMTVICKECGREFKSYDSPNDKYCSHNCYCKNRWNNPRLISHICCTCGEQFKAYKSEHRKYCSSNCYFKSGAPKHGKRKRIKKDCDWCGKTFERPPSNFHATNYFCSKSCSAKWRTEFGLHGLDHPNWTGRYKRDLLMYSNLFKKNRLTIIKRASGNCEICGKKSKRLEVHHVLPVRLCKTNREANKTSNLIALCPKCHSKEDKITRKKYPPQIDLIAHQM